MTQIVAPSLGQLAQVAALRHEQSGGPADGRGDYVEYLLAWADAHRDTHHCRVAVAGDAVVGYGFLVLTERTPSPDRAIRWSADVQTVLVVPDRRGAGLGGELVAALIDLAREQGAEHVTVHCNERAVALYRRAGFAADPHLLFQQV